MASLINNAVFTAAAGGTGAFGVSAALTGYQTPAAAGATDGKTYRYRAQNNDLTQWEIGTTVASSTATSFTRTVVASSTGGTVNFTLAPTVAIVPMAADVLQFDDAMTLTTVQQAMARLTNLNAGIADLWERVGAEPSLDLLADDIAAMFTSTRASTGTYFDADGLMKTAAANVPRVQYNPATRQNEGYLYESAATNLLTRSEEMDNAAWTRTGILAFGSGSVVNATTAPDGATTFDKITEDTGNSVHEMQRTAATTTAADTIHCFSVFLKAAGRTKGRLFNSASNNGYQVSFDLTAGSVSSGSLLGTGTYSGSGIIDCGNGTFRVWVAGTLASGVTTSNTRVRLQDALGVETYTGDGASGLYVWGGQVEPGSYPSSYIPTAGSSVTRSRDAASLVVDTTWHNQSEGTLFLDMTPLGLVGGSSIEQLGFDDLTINNYINLRFGSVIAGCDIVVKAGAVYSVDTGVVGVTPLVRARWAIAYATNDVAMVKDANSPSTDASVTLPTVTRLQIGNGDGGAHYIHRVAYWPKRLTNTQLQLLTAVS